MQTGPQANPVYCLFLQVVFLEHGHSLILRPRLLPCYGSGVKPPNRAHMTQERALFFLENITNYKENRTIHLSITSRCLLPNFTFSTACPYSWFKVRLAFGSSEDVPRTAPFICFCFASAPRSAHNAFSSLCLVLFLRSNRTQCREASLQEVFPGSAPTLHPV